MNYKLSNHKIILTKREIGKEEIENQYFPNSFSIVEYL